MTPLHHCAHEADLGSSSARWLGSSQLRLSRPELGSSPKLLFQAKCYILSDLRGHTNAPSFRTLQMYVPPHQIMLGLCSVQLLLVYGHLLPQRQTLRCDSVHFLQGAEWGERKRRSAVVQHCSVESVASFFTLTGRAAHPPVSLNSKATLQCRERAEEEEQEEDQTQQKLCPPIHFPAGVSQLIHSF